MMFWTMPLLGDCEGAFVDRGIVFSVLLQFSHVSTSLRDQVFTLVVAMSIHHLHLGSFLFLGLST